MHTREEKLEAFGRLLDVLDTLREKCPWDRKQTNESLRPNTIEETFELCEALLRNDTHNICKELGDVMMHVMFYALIGSEKGEFDIADVCNAEADKLIFRHPHVYPPTSEEMKKTGFEQAADSSEVLQNWEQIKLKEKDGNKRVLSGVPNSSASWDLIGNRKKTSGRRYMRNWVSWRQNSARVTRKMRHRNLAISCSV